MLLQSSFTTVLSEVELQPQLHLTHGLSQARYCAERAVVNTCINIAELRMIEDVEGLGAELHAHTFPQSPKLKILLECHAGDSGPRLSHAAVGPRSGADRVRICLR